MSIPSSSYDQCPDSFFSLSSYSYKPLNTGRNEIRLLKLQAPIKSQPLCGNIIHAPLSADLRYWALSYCWGSLVGKRTIILDGKKLQITVNLDDALRQLGNSYGMLWVDAICINQEDIPERSREVLRMGDIYSLAVGVVVWLGVATQTSNRAMDFLLVLATKAPRSQYDEYMKEFPSESDPGKFGDEWMALTDLVRNGYWSRTWIIQELALCRRTKFVHCGTKWLPWDMFKLVFGETKGHIFSKCIAGFAPDVPNGKEISAGLQNLVYLSTFERLLELRNTHVCRLLRLTSSFLATDPRDKVYGILVLNAELRKFIPCPNYANSKGVVFRDLTRAMLASGYNLDLICLKSPTHINQPDVESWVPNWDVHDLLNRSPNWLLKVIDDKCSKSLYFADAGKDYASSILRVWGISYDKVDGLGSSTVHGLFFSIEEAKIKRYDAVKPDHNQNAYGSDVDTLKALKELRQETFHQGYSLNNEGLVLTLYRGNNLEFFQGLQRTMEFNFGGKSLEQWYEMVCTHEHALPLASSFSDVEFDRMKDSAGREMLDVWRWLSTDRGYLGQTHLQTQKGDEIVIVQGCSVPMVLRPCGERYSVICAAYVQGIMNSEALQGVNDDQMQYFDLA